MSNNITGRREPRVYKRRARQGLSVLAAASMLLGGMSLPANAVQFNELEMDWTSTTNTKSIPNGGTAAVDFWVNSNDDKGAKGEQKNTRVKLVADKGVFTKLPDVCLVDAVTPISSISANGKTLDCNMGTIKYGTAKHVEAALRAEGNNGDKVFVTATMGDLAPIKNTPIPISAKAGIEVIANGSIDQSRNKLSGDVRTSHAMAIAIPSGGEFLDGPVEILFRVTDVSGISAVENLRALHATHSTGLTLSGGGSPNIPTMKQGSANLKQVEPGLFKMTITDYAKTFSGLPTHAVDGSALPDDLAYIAAFNMNFETSGAFDNNRRYGYDIKVESVNAVSTSGTKLVEDTNLENNNSNAILVTLGRWAGSWSRSEGYTDKWDNAVSGQGTSWDANAQMLPGEIGESQTGASQWNNVDRDVIPADTRGGLCVIVDNKFVEYQGSYVASRGETVSDKVIDYEYLVDSNANLIEAECDSGKWTKTKPADTKKISGVRASYNVKDLVTEEASRPASTTESLRVGWKVKETVPHAQPLWSVHAVDFEDNSEWIYDRGILRVNHPITNDPYGFAGTALGADVVYAINVRATSSTSITPKEAVLGEPLDVTLGGALNAGNGTQVADGKVRITSVLPKTIKYIDGSADQKPKSVVVNPDGTTTITWENATDFNKENTYKFKVEMVSGAKTPRINTTTTNISPSTTGGEFDSATSSANVRVTSDGETFLEKKTFSKEFAVDSANKWTITMQNKDSRDQDVTDIIDILPYNGDGRGTKMTGKAVIGAVTSTHEGVAYYSSADSKSIKADPSHATNGSFGKPSAIWSTAKPANVTAVRVIGKDLGFGDKQTVVIPYVTEGAHEGDKLSNIAQGRATNTKLKMIKADATTVLPSSLQIDKGLVKPEGETNTNLVPGSKITYDLTVRNSGPGTASRIKVTDKGGKNLVAGSVRPVNLAAGDSFDEKTGIWTLGGTLALNKTRTLRVEATISPDAKGTVIENSASVENPTNPPKETCIPNVGVESDTDQCDVEVVTIDNLLKIDKKMNTKLEDIQPGGNVEYTITGMNAGTTVANDVSIKDIPLDGLVADSVVISDPSKGEIVDGVWKIASLGAGEKVTAKVTAKLSDEASIIDGIKNSTTIENPWHPTDPKNVCESNATVEDDTDQCDFTLTKVDNLLKIDKKLTTLSENIVPNGDVEYILTGMNAGKHNASNVVIKDIPLEGLVPESIVISEPSHGEIVDGVWNVGLVKPNEKVTAKVNAKLAETASLKDGFKNATTIENPWHPVGPVEETKPNETVEEDDDQRDWVEYKNDSELKIHKNLVSEDHEVLPGDPIEYSITGKNVGPDSAYNVVIKDIPGDGLVPESIELVDPSHGEIVDGVWVVGTVKVDEEVTVKVNAVVAEDANIAEGIKNRSTIENPWTPPGEECAPNDSVDEDTDRCDEVVVKRDTNLQIAKILDTPHEDLLPGSIAEYTITVQNSGADTDYDVLVEDFPVSGLEGIELSDPTGGELVELEDGKQAWYFEKLEPKTEDGKNVFTIKAKGKVLESAANEDGIRNTAIIDSPWNPKTDEVCESNNEDVNADTDQCDTVVVGLSDELKIDKSPVDDQEWVVGNEVEYLITVKNPSEFAAHNVVVNDQPVSELDNVRLEEPSKGAIDEENKLAWNVGTLEAGESATIKVFGTVGGVALEDGIIVNKATTENPWNPLDPNGECVPNADVDKDTDQCDTVTVERTADVPPVDPADPATPGKPPVIDSGLGAGAGDYAPWFIGAGSILILGAGMLLARMRKRSQV